MKLPDDSTRSALAGDSTEGRTDRMPGQVPAEADVPSAVDPSAHLSVASPTRAWRVIDRMMAIGFAIGLAVPGLLLLGGLRPPEIENRPLLTPPEVTLGGILDPAWYGELDRYVADNLALRVPAVRLRAIVEVQLLGGTTNTSVIRGRGDWLFAAAEMRPTCDLSASEALARVDKVARDLAARNRTFRYLPIPDKHAIYPDQVRPDSPLPVPCTDLERRAMRRGIDARPNIAIDGWQLLEALRSTSSSDGPLYFYQDSHWTPQAALAEFRALVESIQPGIWNDADVVVSGTMSRDQELARVLGLSRTEEAPDVRVRSQMHVVKTDAPVKQRLHAARAVFEYRVTGDRPLIGGRTLIVYDSFFGIYIDRLTPFFENSVWVHVDDLTRNPTLATELGPFDHVILERVERELYRTPVDTLFAPLLMSSG